MQSIFTKKRFLFLITIVVICLVMFKIKSNSKNSEILSDPLKKGSIVESIYGIGTVTASKSFILKTGVTNTILRIYVKEGDNVTAGQRLIDLDQGVTFTAPFSGTITALPIKVGETVFPQSPLLTLTDLSDRYLIVSLDQKGAVKVQQNQSAKISFESLRDQTFEGKITSIYSNESNFLVRINVKNLPKEILPGMTADVAIGINEKKDVLLIPVAALLNKTVQVKSAHGKPRSVEIGLGLVDSEMAEVVTGDLKEGDQLLIKENTK